ncbi:MAG: Gfo/Idh/MocA family oxidoreductase [Verrucomicrobiota bacterium]
MTKRYTRRWWLKSMGAGAGLVGASRLFQAPFVLADSRPNSKLGTAVIGCGGRGEASLAAALGEKLVAIVDVDDGRLAATSKKAAKSGAKPRAFFDYRRMFDAMHREIDAVFVATPDHHHAPASMRAIQLGKHVLCEKPLCHDLWQARALAKAANEHKVTTMMGNQGHCDEGYRRLCEYLWAGAIGDVLETHSWSGFVNGGAGGRPPIKPVPAGLHWEQWLGPAPYRDYHEGLHPLYWRYYWDFGTGGLGDWGCHNLDGVFWALKPRQPASIECLGTIGGGNEKYPQASVIRWTIPAREGLSAFQAYWYDGGKLPADAAKDHEGSIQVPNYPPMLAEFEKKYEWDFHEGWDGGTIYIGAKGVMHTGCYGQRPRLWPEAAHRAFPVPERRIPRIKGSHFDHFIQSCKEGKPTCADFGYASAITEFLLLGHLAIRAGVGAKVEWDSANLRCPNLPGLNRWVKRECRAGWEFNPG